MHDNLGASGSDHLHLDSLGRGKHRQAGRHWREEAVREGATIGWHQECGRTAAVRVRPTRHDHLTTGSGRTNQFGQAASPISEQQHPEDGKTGVERRILDTQRLTVHHLRIAAGKGLETLTQAFNHGWRDVDREHICPRFRRGERQGARSRRDIQHPLTVLHAARQRQGGAREWRRQRLRKPLISSSRCRPARFIAH